MSGMSRFVADAGSVRRGIREKPHGAVFPVKGGSLIHYINAEDILPKNLLDEIRRYFEGGAIYVPRSDGRAAWGSGSGTRAELDARNRAIRSEYAAGTGTAELAEKYCLSADSIRKIVRGA